MAEASLPRAKRLFPAIALPEVDAARGWLLFVAVVFFAAALVSSTDPDYWWHLRTGQLIVANRAVPSTDPYSFTAEGEPWVAHEWLSEVIVYATQSLGGYGLSLLLFVAVALATLLLTYRTSLWLGASRWAALVLFIWAGLMTVPYWTVRPQIFTWFLFATFIAVCLQHHRGGKHRLWLLPPLMVLWANLHLGYAFGLAVVGVYAASLAGERLIWKEQRPLKPVFLVLAACVAATLLTPAPVELLLYPLKYVRPGNTNIAWINEWQSPDFHNPFFLPLALALLALAGLGVAGKRRELFLPMLALIFAFLTLQSVRNQPLFAIVFMLIASQRAPDLWAWAAAAAQKQGARPHSALNLVLVGTASAALLFAVVSSSSSQLRWTPSVDRGIEYPEAGVHYLRDNYPDARVFNLYEWGGYLINELYPKKVFIDGRSDFYGDKLMNEWHDVHTLAAGWEGIVAEHGIEAFLIKTDSPLAVRLDAEPERWVRVFTGPVEALYVRSDLVKP
jgi:hypothetical protein